MFDHLANVGLLNRSYVQQSKVFCEPRSGFVSCTNLKYANYSYQIWGARSVKFMDPLPPSLTFGANFDQSN